MQNHRARPAVHTPKRPNASVHRVRAHSRKERSRMASLGRSKCMQRRRLSIEAWLSIGACARYESIAYGDDSHFRVWFHLVAAQLQSFLSDSTEYIRKMYTVIIISMFAGGNAATGGASKRRKRRMRKRIRNMVLRNFAIWSRSIEF